MTIGATSDYWRGLLSRSEWIKVFDCDTNNSTLEDVYKQPASEQAPRIGRIREAVLLSEPVVVGVVRNGTLQLFTESTSYHPWRSSELRRLTSIYQIPDTLKIKRLEKAAALCFEWSDNFWHWMVEYLPYACDLEARGFDGIYLTPSGSRLYCDTLRFFGIPKERILEKSDDLFLVDELYLPDRGVGQNAIYPSLIRRTQKLALEKTPVLRQRRLYIARRTSRVVINEADVMQELGAFGFEQVYMEDYPVEEQIMMAAGSDAICGPHGAGMTAAMFMKNGGTLIEMFSPSYINPCMLGICEILGHSYAMVMPRVYREEAYSHALDIVVDIALLRSALSSVCAHLKRV